MVFDIFGSTVASIADVSGNTLGVAYNIGGEIIFHGNWRDEIIVQKFWDSPTNTNYYFVRIPQERPSGDKQYPFVYAPNGSGAGTKSTLAMNTETGFMAAINAGVFTSGNVPIGIIIQNGNLIQQGNSSLYALTIDGDGNLGYAEPNTSGQMLINNGVVSAVVGFVPIIINHTGVSSNIYELVTSYSQYAQRQIIGQFDNGDYAIITCEGRGYDNSTGWTIPQAISICTELELQYAYNLDGGGSTETVLGKRQINTIYEGSYGRIVPTYIVFNGTDTFAIPG